MSWERFAYICRRAKFEMRESESVEICLAKIDQNPAAELYGKKLSSGAMASNILKRIGRLNSRDEALKSLELYSQLNLPNHMAEPIYFKRVLAYLAYIAVVFYFLVGVYQFKVVPQFVAALADLGQPAPDSLLWFQSYWFVLLLLVTVLMSAALFIGYELKSLFRFEAAPQNSVVYRYLTGAKIRRAYQAILDIIQYPLNRVGDGSKCSSSKISAHLDDIAGTQMCLADEMTSLLNIAMQDLLGACEKQLKVITIIVALTVVATIFIFLASAYSPLFILGNAI